MLMKQVCKPQDLKMLQDLYTIICLEVCHHPGAPYLFYFEEPTTSLEDAVHPAQQDLFGGGTSACLSLQTAQIMGRVKYTSMAVHLTITMGTSILEETISMRQNLVKEVSLMPIKDILWIGS